MKILINILFFCCISYSVVGQQCSVIEYRCFIKKDCSDSIIPYRNYSLAKKEPSRQNQVFGSCLDHQLISPDKNFVCLLPDTGVYNLVIYEDEGPFFLLTKTIFFNSSSPVFDTLQTCDLGRFSTVYNPAKRDPYLYCGKVANGHIVDCTMDGWTEGNFKDGFPISPIKYFNKQHKLIKKLCLGENGYMSRCN